ncbi:MAG: porin [Gammaproteobacteria bacterium]|nr:porin [Gammaproteobacteria bacterium]
MNKKLLAIAISAAVMAPLAANANDNVIYGKMHFSWDYVDTNNVGGVDASDDVTGVAKSSRIGFKGSEDLGDGMSAVWQVEGAVPNATFSNRNTFVGLAGGFGTVLMGRHDTPYKISTGSLDIFGDTIADYNSIIGQTNNAAGTANVNAFDLRVGQTVAYITPNLNGFTGAIARVSTKNPEASGNDEQAAWSLAGMYSNGPLFASLAYEKHSGAAAGNSTTTQNEKAWKLGLGYSFGDGKIGFIYEDISHEASNSRAERNAWLVNYAHTFGNNVFKIAYGVAGDSDVAGANDGADNLSLGLEHKFSKRTSIYGIYTAMDNDAGANYGFNTAAGYAAVTGRNVDALSFGIVHTF